VRRAQHRGGGVAAVGLSGASPGKMRLRKNWSMFFELFVEKGVNSSGVLRIVRMARRRCRRP
jgi:hypothetical protein